MVTLILMPGTIDVEEILLLSAGVIICIGWMIWGYYAVSHVALFRFISLFYEDVLFFMPYMLTSF